VTRRIVIAIVATTLVAVVAFGAPLAVAIESRSRDDEIDRLQRLASVATAVVPSDGSVDRSRPLPEPPAGVTLGLYDASGARVAGSGPPTADHPVRSSLMDGSVASAAGRDELVAVAPVHAAGRTIAAVRASEPEDITNGAVRGTWLVMVTFAALAVVAGVTLGIVLTRRLVRPIRRLRDDARRLGDGDFSLSYEPSGVGEIDEAGDALEATAARLAGMVERERAFTANASHQLRTPVAGLRTILEAELEQPRGDPHVALRDALRQVDRLESTMSDLLAVARDTHRPGPFVLDRFVTDLRERWEPTVRHAGRDLVVRDADQALDVDASQAAIRQAVDVLIDNAVHHGEGPITVHATGLADGSAASISVSDEGRGIPGDAEAIFRRRHPDARDHGIGLALARSLIEAEGGRLRLATAVPPEFTIVVPAHQRASDERRPFTDRDQGRPAVETV
jgi:signal transduction histidine kinase